MLIAALNRETRVIWTTRLYGFLDCLGLPPLDGVKLVDYVDHPDVLEHAMIQAAVYKQRSRIHIAFTHGQNDCHYYLEMHPVPGNHEICVMMFGFAKPPEGNFSHLDREVLFLLAHDCSIKHIPALLDRTQSAIDNRIRRLKDKTGCDTLHGIMAYALKTKML
jgi:DNA-binding NarL/FixJ family response regulator